MALYAEVAIRSKLPNDSFDYRVIANSQGVLDANDFNDLFGRLTVGTLQAGDLTPGAQAPWHTFGSYSKNGELYLAAIRHDWTGQREVHVASRQIIAATCLCVPYRMMAEASVGFTDLARSHYDMSVPLAQAGVSLPKAEVRPVPLEHRLARLANLLEREIDFTFASELAGLILCVPVALRGDALPVESRLEYLDAIVSLLPFGARTDLSAGTWVQSASAHTIRVGFTDAPRSDQHRVVWGQTPIDNLGAYPQAREYARLLATLKQRSNSTYDLLLRLARHTQPLHLSAPLVVGALRDLDFPFVVWDDVRAGKGNLDDVRELFNRKQATSLSLEQRNSLLVFLMDAMEQPKIDIPVLATYWHPTLQTPLMERAHRGMGASDDTRLEALAELATRVGLLSRLLEEAVAYGDKAAQRDESRPYQLAGRLLASRYGRLPRDEGYLRLSALIGGRPRLMWETMLALTPSHVSKESRTLGFLGELIQWLSGGRKENEENLELIRILYSGQSGTESKSLIPEHLVPLANTGDQYVRALTLQLLQTSDKSLIYRTLPSLIRWLLTEVARLSQYPAELNYWRVLLHQFVPLFSVAQIHVQYRAMLDSLYLLLDEVSPPPFFRSYASAPAAEFGSYLAVLGEALTQKKSTQHAPDVFEVQREKLRTEGARRLLRHALARANEADVEFGAAGAANTQNAQKGAYLYDNLQLVADNMKKDNSPLNPKDPSGVAKLDLVNGLRRANQSTQPSTVAKLCANVIVNDQQGGLDYVLEALKKRKYLAQLPTYLHFIEALDASLAPRMGKPESATVRATLNRMVLEKAFGEQLAYEYVKRQLASIEYHVGELKHLLNGIEDYLDEEMHRKVYARINELGGDRAQKKITWKNPFSRG